jgi:hypothetical protein
MKTVLTALVAVLVVGWTFDVAPAGAARRGGAQQGTVPLKAKDSVRRPPAAGRMENAGY